MRVSGGDKAEAGDYVPTMAPVLVELDQVESTKRPWQTEVSWILTCCYQSSIRRSRSSDMNHRRVVLP